jgi:hypothetical protein
VRDPERRVAVTHVADDHPHADEVVDVGELAIPGTHLLVDRPQVLRPAGDRRPHLRPFERLGERRHDLVDDALPFGLAFGDHALELAELLRVQRLEGEVLELPLDPVDAEPVRERRIDLEGLGRLPDLLLAWQRMDRAQVVEPVAQLDQQDAQILRRREHHLAQRLGLLRLTGVQRQRIDLRDAVDEEGDVGAEGFLDLLEGDRRVLDDVVEHRGLEGGGVHAELGEQPRDLHRMPDERLPGLAELPGVVFLGEPVGALEALDVDARGQPADLAQIPIEGAAGVTESTRQDAA